MPPAAGSNPTDELREALGDPTLDPELLVLALTHRSFAYENGNLPTNERLEFLGDSVLGVVITETLYLTHPDLSEGRLAKLRAAVVNARALADVARTIDLGGHIRLGKGEEATGGREKASILSDTVEALIGAIYLSGGFEDAARVVHLLFDPMLEAAAAMGAGLDWKTSLQELSALHDLGVPEYVIEDEGPDHMKTFTARVRVADRLHGRGVGRSKKEAEQQAAETAYRTLSAELPNHEGNGHFATTGDRGQGGASAGGRCLSSPRSRSSAPASRPTSWAARSSPSRCSTPVRYAATPAGPDDFAARLTGRTFTGAHRRGKYLWLSLDNGDALLGHLGMSGQMLVQPPGVPDETAPAGPLPARRGTRGWSCGSSTSGCSAGWRSPRAAPTYRRRSRTSPGTRSTRSSTTTRSSAGCGAASRASSGSCSTRAVVSGVGNIYADEGLWLARVHGERLGLEAPRVRRTPRARRLPRGDARRPGPGRDLLRRPLRQRQRAERLLRPLPGGLRPRGRALLPLRYADPADHLHEPLLVLLPGLPAGAPPAARTPVAGLARDQHLMQP